MTTIVFAAHPDDEVLGAGATIARLAREGEEVHIHILGEGATSRAAAEASEAVERLQRQARRACDILGASSLSFHGLPDNRFDAVDLLDLVRVVEAILGSYQVDRVLTHAIGDLNIDHQLTARAVATATRPFGANTPSTVMSFEVLSSTEWSFGQVGRFDPDHFIEVSADDLAAKISALRCYQDELREAPHPRSADGVTALAKLRGSVIGANHAEAFSIVRTVSRLGSD